MIRRFSLPGAAVGRQIEADLADSDIVISFRSWPTKSRSIALVTKHSNDNEN